MRLPISLSSSIAVIAFAATLTGCSGATSAVPAVGLQPLSPAGLNPNNFNKGRSSQTRDGKVNPNNVMVKCYDC
jgi:hypothetical protein